MAPNPSQLTLDERRAALASLTYGLDEAPAGGGTRLVRTGDEVDGAGPDATGTVKRLLIRNASSIGYMTPAGYQRAGAVPGDVVRLTKDQAKRLDGLGVTLPADTDLDAIYDGADRVPDAPEGTTVTVLDGEDAPKTDEDLAGMGAEELVAYVGQNADQAERVRALEEARPKNKQRKTILAATDPAALEEARRVAEEAAAALSVGQVLDGEVPGDEPDGDDD